MTKSIEHKPLISIIVPVYNEENNIELAYGAIVNVFDSQCQDYSYEIIFTDNHSSDGSFPVLERLAQRDSNVRVIRFSRNFGFNRSILTGYRHARGAAALQMDCDLQDPPDMLPEFLSRWREGHDVVSGIRQRRPESAAMRLVKRLYYRGLNAISEDNLPFDSGDFRLVDRSILDQLNQIHDASPYVRGLISSLAARQVGVPYTRKSRCHDKSKFTLGPMLQLAVDGVLSHSILPLRLAALAGLVAALAALSLLSFHLTRLILFDVRWPSGLATIVMLVLLGMGMNGIFFGIVGEYVGRIYLEVRKRPTTVVERAINFDKP